MGFLSHPHPSSQIFCHRTKGGNNSHRSGKTGNLLKIPHITNSLVSLYTAQCISLVCLNTVCTLKFFTAEFVDHSHGVPAEKYSIPAGILQLTDPSPWCSRNIQNHTHGKPADSVGFPPSPFPCTPLVQTLLPVTTQPCHYMPEK